MFSYFRTTSTVFEQLPQQMAGPSMLPTLGTEGELVIVDRLSIRRSSFNINRGELLVLLSPLDPQRFVCKRVLGLPGDIICVDPTGEKAPSTEHVVIPKGHVWIIGDNASASRDSRTYGPVPMGLIQGKLKARVRSESLSCWMLSLTLHRSGLRPSSQYSAAT